MGMSGIWRMRNACPCCGYNSVVSVRDDHAKGEAWQLRCDNCGARGPSMPTTPMAVTAWIEGKAPYKRLVDPLADNGARS